MACGGLKFLETEVGQKDQKAAEFAAAEIGGQSANVVEASSPNSLISPRISDSANPRKRNYTERVLDLAIDMFRYVENTTFEMGVKLTLKIGIHHGNCTYGVIGYHKPQFSLIGDTVNTTSRHCTTGDPGTIVLSSAAHSKLPSPRRDPSFKRKSVPMKGKGDVDVFMLKPSFLNGQLIRKPFNENLLHINTRDTYTDMNFNKAIIKGVKDSHESPPSSLNEQEKYFLNNQLGENYSPGVNQKKKRFEFTNRGKVLLEEEDLDSKNQMEDQERKSVSAPSQNSKTNKRHYQPRHMTAQVGAHDALKLSLVPQQSSREELGSIHQEGPQIELDPLTSQLIDSTPHQGAATTERNRPEMRVVFEMEQDQVILKPILAQQNSVIYPDDDSESEEEDDNELKRKNMERMSKVMKSFLGYAYTFKNEKEALKAFYNKQMRLKYRTKLRKTLFHLVALIFIQEMLLWIGFLQGYSVSSMRVGFFSWIFVTMLYLLLSSKVYKQIVVVLILAKTFLYSLELYILGEQSPKTASSQFFNMNMYCLYFISQFDSVLFISVGIFTVSELLFLNALSYLHLLLHLMIYRQTSTGLRSLLLNITIFYLYNCLDILNHFDTEINTFFNFIKIEQRGYYLTTFVERLLPKHIRGVASSGTERYENVTLLFADIVGFTEYSAGKNPRQVVQMLSQLFTAFDKECNSLDLYKLYTIGDCYVVMSFLDKNNRKSPAEEAADVLRLSLFMLQSISKVRLRIKFDKLNMRIGIHTGTVFGGVIGTEIVRFDLYGPDVLTANKMESGGEPGEINVSQTTKALLDTLDTSNFTFRPHKEIEIKSLGRKLHSYFLNVPSDEGEDRQSTD